MNPDTGQVYPSLNDAVAQGELRENLVEVIGTPEQVRKLSMTVQQVNEKSRRHTKNKQARKSRRRNR